jgi:hypothetical protein
MGSLLEVLEKTGDSIACRRADNVRTVKMHARSAESLGRVSHAESELLQLIKLKRYKIADFPTTEMIGRNRQLVVFAPPSREC